MQLCCIPQLTCFYNPVGFTFAFKMFMFILISNYVYSILQLSLYSIYFISCSIPIPFLFIFMSRSDMFLGVQDYLSIRCQANFLPILPEFWVHPSCKRSRKFKVGWVDGSNILYQKNALFPKKIFKRLWSGLVISTLNCSEFQQHTLSNFDGELQCISNTHS